MLKKVDPRNDDEPDKTHGHALSGGRDGRSQQLPLVDPPTREAISQKRRVFVTGGFGSSRGVGVGHGLPHLTGIIILSLATTAAYR